MSAKRHISANSLIIWSCLGILLTISVLLLILWMLQSGAAQAAPVSPAPAPPAPQIEPAPAPPAGLDAEPGDILHWTCAMHPAVRSDHPGECPICHMDLIPVHAEQANEGPSPDEPRIRLNRQARELGQITTVPVAYQQMEHVINATGHLTLDEQHITHVHARISGWIDRAFVEFTGAQVNPGDPLVSIYSEELVTAQQEYLLALSNRDRLARSPLARAREGAEAVVTAARQRLLRWQINADQIGEIERTGEVQDHLILYYEAPQETPHGGVVTERMVVEGQRVERGDQLYTIADLSSLWMLADVYEYEMAWIQTGQHVEITAAAFPGRAFGGRISFIDPMLNPETRSVQVRVSVANANMELRPNMFVSAKIHIPLDESNEVLTRMVDEVQSREASSDPVIGPEGAVLVIPDLALLRTGERELVYVEAEPGTYIQRTVISGPTGELDVNGQTETYVPVLSGLREGERVVSRGNFLIDSQTTLTGSASAAYGSALEAGTSGDAPASTPDAPAMPPMPGMSH